MEQNRRPISKRARLPLYGKTSGRDETLDCRKQVVHLGLGQDMIHPRCQAFSLHLTAGMGGLIR